MNFMFTFCYFTNVTCLKILPSIHDMLVYDLCLLLVQMVCIDSWKGRCISKPYYRWPFYFYELLVTNYWFMQDERSIVVSTYVNLFL